MRHVMSLYEQISGKMKMEFVPFFGPHNAVIKGDIYRRWPGMSSQNGDVINILTEN
jgi:hypothetical protein